MSNAAKVIVSLPLLPFVLVAIVFIIIWLFFAVVLVAMFTPLISTITGEDLWTTFKDGVMQI